LEVSPPPRSLITVDGGSGARAWTAPASRPAVDDACRGRLDSLEHIVVVRHTGIDVPMTRPATCSRRDPRRGGRRLPGRADEAEHPLFISTLGSTGQAEGIVHTTGGLFDGVSSTHGPCSTSIRSATVLVLEPTSAGSPGHSYISLRAALQRRDERDVRGRARLPAQGIWWELIERYGVTIFYTAPTAIRACMKWGPSSPTRMTCRACGYTFHAIGVGRLA
jgi:acetyl-CoA synthetase